MAPSGDLFTIRGQYGWKPTLPAIGGSEAVAWWMRSAGRGGLRRGVGDRRVGARAWAEYFVADAPVPVPDAMPDNWPRSWCECR